MDNDTILRFYKTKLVNEIQSLSSDVLETPPTTQGLPVDVAHALKTIHEYLASEAVQSEDETNSVFVSQEKLRAQLTSLRERSGN